MLVMLITTMLICSCSKDDDDSSSQGSNGLRPGARVEGMVTVGGRTYTRTVGGTIGEAVDLGLPSGTLWASHNIGATKPEEYGAYLAWGELGAKEEGYIDGIKNDYYWSSYKYSDNGSLTGMTKYTIEDGRTSGIWYSNGTFVGDGITTLEAMDDAAAFNWGGDWTMPTLTQMEELFNSVYTTWIWTTQNGVSGYKVVSKQMGNNNSIFLPASGSRFGSSLYNDGSNGYYWSSSLNTYHSDRGRYLYFLSGHHYTYDSYYYRFYGFSVRPVRVQN